MKTNDDPIDKLLDRLITSTRSPRGKFSAENSWKILESRLFARRIKRRFWLRTTSAAAVVLLCVASWAAYHALSFEPASPAPTISTETPPAATVPGEVLVFRQQPLEEIALRLSQTFHRAIRIDDDSLRNYRMTATFDSDESLTVILDLLKEAGKFDYEESNDTIVITKLN